MPECPERSHDETGDECVPPFLEGIDGISHVAELFSGSGDKERNKEER
jgi:hypothetical protein